MATKVAIQVMVFALVFIMLATHPGWGEQDCYDEKDAVIRKCMVTIIFIGDYVDFLERQADRPAPFSLKKTRHQLQRFLAQFSDTRSC